MWAGNLVGGGGLWVGYVQVLITAFLIANYTGGKICIYCEDFFFPPPALFNLVSGPP